MFSITFPGLQTTSPTYLDALVMQLQAIPNPPREHIANLRAISALLATALHPPLLVHDAPLDDTISDGLAHNVLGVFLRVEVQLNADVAEGDARVREGEPADTCFYDILTKADDKSVSFVGFKLGSVLRQRGLELRERTRSDGWGNRYSVLDGCIQRVAFPPLTISKYAPRAFSSTGCLNKLRSGISPIKSSTTTKNLCTA